MSLYGLSRWNWISLRRNYNGTINTCSVFCDSELSFIARKRRQLGILAPQIQCKLTSSELFIMLCVMFYLLQKNYISLFSVYVYSFRQLQYVTGI